MYSKIISVVALLSATAIAAPTNGHAPLPTGFHNTCNNQGYLFSVFENASPSTSKVPTDWDEKNMDTLTPDFMGTRSVIGINNNSPPSGKNLQPIYGSQPLNTQHVGIKHSGFFFATETGDYTVALKNTDDAAYVFVGGDCRRENQQSLGNQMLSGAPVTKKIHVDAGHYVPFDIRWANVMGGPYNLDVTITSPSGKAILGKDAPSQNLLVNKLCTAADENLIWTASGLTN